MTVRSVAPVDEVVDAIITKLRANGYMESTIKIQSRELEQLRRWCLGHGGQYTVELGAAFAAMTTSPKTGRFSHRRYQSFGRMTRLADSYLVTGQVDLGTRKRTQVTNQWPVSEEFHNLLADWERDIVGRGLATESCHQSREIARRFLLHVESAGHNYVNEITGEDVIGFVAELGKMLSAGSVHTYVSVLRPFLKFMKRGPLVAAASVSRFERPRVILGILTDFETAAVFDVLASGKVAARDQAIVLLSLTGGLRACDIVGLMLEDIDWRGELISLVQTKTGNPLTLPLLPVVSNPLAKYLLDERPDTKDRHLFVRNLAPHVRLSDHAAVYFVMERVFTQAGLSAGRCGTRLARHSAASKMLATGTPLPTIAAVLGHARPQSVDRYLETNLDQLRTCVLPLPEAVTR